ncbi:MAG: hypothetical protein CM15mP84_05220 [Cellvibrionales bacterium]|nr:MAG: hypothetical protein CM15mP84_05220 [Cellvibrionales bacterium]
MTDRALLGDGGWFRGQCRYECDVTGGTGDMAGAGGPDSDRRHQQLLVIRWISTRGHVTQNEVDYRTLLHHYACL